MTTEIYVVPIILFHITLFSVSNSFDFTTILRSVKKFSMNKENNKKTIFKITSRQQILAVKIGPAKINMIHNK